MNGPCLQVGVMAGSPEQLGEFVRLVQTSGHRPAVSIDLSRPMPVSPPAADVWFTSSAHADIAHHLLEYFDSHNTPVVFNDDSPPGEEEAQLSAPELRQRRAKRLAARLESLCHGQVLDRTSEKSRPKSVWVLGASTGGPQAVAEFLGALPKSLSDVAFVYVQHIYDESIQTLKIAVQQRCPFTVHMVDAPRVVREKTLYIAPPTCQIELREDGVIQPLSQPWYGAFSPSIDQVVAKVARTYGRRGGVIIFTGMGDDGARSSKLLAYRGGQVWAQSPASCAVDSMPVSLNEHVKPSFQGTPVELAEAFKKYIQTDTVILEN